jgi:hypothetical protein
MPYNIDPHARIVRDTVPMLPKHRPKRFATPRRWWALAIVVLLVALVLPSVSPDAGAWAANSAPGISSPLSATTTAPTLSITDGQTLKITSPHHSKLTDSITYGESTSGQRSYTIHLNTTYGLPSVPLTVDTFPVFQWGLPDQLPGGDDSLPPLDLWYWNVSDLGHNVSSEWTASSWDQRLSGPTTWTNQTIWIRGSTDPEAIVSFNPSKGDGTWATGGGFVMNTPGVGGAIPTNDSTFTSTAAALHPSVVRFSTTTAETDLVWNVQTNQPIYNFTLLDRLANFTYETGGAIVLSLPAGSWGDGNLLPTGMPENLSVPVQGPGAIGYFPSNGAWVAYVEGIVNHTMGRDEHISYWSIGNEVPLSSPSVVAAYTNIFNIAAATIHAKLPHALVGSDAMTNLTYEPYFAHHAVGVGFLSFHLYPSVGLCVRDGAYCPPRGAPRGATDAGLFSHSSYQFMGKVFQPVSAQDLWYNDTGHWIPVLNTETNLNGWGSSYHTRAIGTDPRIQTLFGASWLTSLLIDSSFQNVSSIAYFSLSSGWGIPNTVTAPYGGWGFGMTREDSQLGNVLYAPYLALELWGQSIPYRAPGVLDVSSEPSVVQTYAAKQGNNLSVVLESRVNVPINVQLDLDGSGYQLSSVTTLEQSSYDEVYEPQEHETVLDSDGLSGMESPKSSSLTLTGYAVAVAKYTATSEAPAASGGVGVAGPTNSAPEPLGGAGSAGASRLTVPSPEVRSAIVSHAAVLTPPWSVAASAVAFLGIGLMIPSSNSIAAVNGTGPGTSELVMRAQDDLEDPSRRMLNPR